MDKQQFYQQQKADLKTKYAALRKQKMKRPEALLILATQYSLSKSTISSILTDSNYRKRSKSSKVKTVPKPK